MKLRLKQGRANQTSPPKASVRLAGATVSLPDSLEVVMRPFSNGFDPLTYVNGPRRHRANLMRGPQAVRV